MAAGDKVLVLPVLSGLIAGGLRPDGQRWPKAWAPIISVMCTNDFGLKPTICPACHVFWWLLRVSARKLGP
jgi:hypothetical protein